MFKERISGTPLTSPAANDYFADSIVGQSWNSDDTFIATCRALLAPRMKDGNTLHLIFTKSNYGSGSLEGLSPRNAVNTICDDFYDSEWELHIHNFYSMDETHNAAWMKVIEENFTNCYEGWHRVEKVTVFFRKVFNVLCYIQPEHKSVAIFTDNMNLQKMHYLQCGIFAFMPWYFDQSAGVTELEMELINSLREKKYDHYLDCLARIAEQYDFKTARVRKLLKGFETSYERIRCDQIKNDLNRIIQNLATLDGQYADMLHRKTDAENLLLGLEMKIKSASEDSEIMDYFLTNNHLILKDVTGSTMEFVVIAPLDYFDEDQARRYINNDSSYFYDYVNRHEIYSRDNLRMLWTEIFVKQRLKVQFCSAYRFRLEGSVESLSGYDDYGTDCREYTPNPHIDRYNCMGDYKRIINGLLKDHDYIGALEQSIASCKSLNIGDSPVMNEFVSRFCGRSGSKNMRCIRMPDGSVMTPNEAIKWLLDEKKAQEAAEENPEPAPEVQATEGGTENG